MSRCEVCLHQGHEWDACPAPSNRATVTIRIEDLHRLAERFDRAHEAYVSERGTLAAALEVVDEAEHIVQAAQRQLGGAA